MAAELFWLVLAKRVAFWTFCLVVASWHAGTVLPRYGELATALANEVKFPSVLEYDHICLV